MPKASYSARTKSLFENGLTPANRNPLGQNFTRIQGPTANFWRKIEAETRI